MQEKKVFIVDNLNYINKDNTNYYIVINGYDELKKKNIFFLENILFQNQKKYKNKFINKVEQFHLSLRKTFKKEFNNNEINNFYLNSLLHPDLMKENNDQYLLLKNLVFIDIFTKYRFKEINLKTVNTKFIDFVSIFSKKKKIKLNIFKKDYFYLNLKENLLIFYKHIKQICYLIIKSKFKIKKKIIQNKILIFGFLAHLNFYNINKLRLDYWNNLDEFLEQKKINLNWIYFFYPSSILKSLTDARNYLKKINKKRKDNFKHQLIDDYFTKFDVFNCLIIYILHFFKNINTKIKVNRLFFLKDFIFMFSIKNNFTNSIFGFSYFENLLLIKTFNNYFSLLGPNNKVIYLMENQKWEKILNFNCFEKKIISYGFSHSGVRNMDLRYFVNNSSTIKKEYLPTKVIVHSMDTVRWAKKINYRKKKVVKLESLRFLKSKFNQSYDLNKKKFFQKKSCLVFLDIYDKEFSPILDIIKKLYHQKKLKNVYVKIHPTNDKRLIKKCYPFIKFINNINQTKGLNFIITGSNTTASYHSLYYKLPLFIYLRSGYLNMVPELGKIKINYFYDYNSFKKKLNNLKILKFPKNNIHFNDDKIPLWKKFIMNLDKNRS